MTVAAQHVAGNDLDAQSGSGGRFQKTATFHGGGSGREGGEWLAGVSYCRLRRRQSQLFQPTDDLAAAIRSRRVATLELLQSSLRDEPSRAGLIDRGLKPHGHHHSVATRRGPTRRIARRNSPPALSARRKKTTFQSPDAPAGHCSADRWDCPGNRRAGKNRREESSRFQMENRCPTTVPHQFAREPKDRCWMLTAAPLETGPCCTGRRPPAQSRKASALPDQPRRRSYCAGRAAGAAAGSG